MLVAKAMIQAIFAGLFIGCLFALPYGYYQFVRLASLVLFGILTYIEFKNQHYALSILCVCAALLFNPVLPIFLDRNTWQEIDKIMASLMILWIMVDTVLLIVQKTRKHSVSFQNAEVFEDAFVEEPQREAIPAEI